MNTLAKLIASIAALIVSLTFAWIAKYGVEIRLSNAPGFTITHFHMGH
jgi:hypothetical protein